MSYDKKAYLKANKVKIAKQKRAYYLANEEKYIAYQKEWHSNNKDKKRKNQKLRLSKDTAYKLKVNIKNLIGNSIRNKNFKKSSPTEQILGCTYHEFKQHLEAKWEPWMNWNNHGKYNGTMDYGWDIDHITPLSTATSEEELIRLNHYTNLQPLCSYVNRKIKRHKS